MGSLPGVKQSALVMATPLNLRVLADAGFADPVLKHARTDDLVVALEAEDEASMGSAVKEAERLLAMGETPKSATSAPSSLQEAIASAPDSNLAVISVPGAYAKREGLASLNAGLNVFMFSSNVSRQDERALKVLAREKGLLMMGPDCGTAIINHTVLGFGNAVREGTIGIVSASGTGLQEVATLVHRSGLGISQAIGTGGGDLSDIVGGLMTLEGLRILEEDRKTSTIVVVSKPPGPRTMKLVLKQVRACKKKVVVNFLGARLSRSDLGKQRAATTLEEAAAIACKDEMPREARGVAIDPGDPQLAFDEAQRLSAVQKYVRGLYAGGTLSTEAQLVLTPLVGPVHSNSPLDPRLKVEGTARSRGHACIDMGAEEFVVGRAHPMMDFTLRKMRIVQEARDPGTAVILLDVELGIGSNPDPAGELVPAIQQAKEISRREGRYLSVVASLVGTEGDFQGLPAQESRLSKAGVVMAGSNEKAAALAALIATRGETRGGRKTS